MLKRKRSKIALVENPKNPINKIIFFSSKNRFAVVMEPSGRVVSVYEINKFKAWNEWKSAELAANSVVLEVPIDSETKRICEGIRDRLKRTLRRLSSR